MCANAEEDDAVIIAVSNASITHRKQCAWEGAREDEEDNIAASNVFAMHAKHTVCESVGQDNAESIAVASVSVAHEVVIVVDFVRTRAARLPVQHELQLSCVPVAIVRRSNDLQNSVALLNERKHVGDECVRRAWRRWLVIVWLPK